MATNGYLHDYTVRAAAALGRDLEACITVREHGLTLLAASSSAASARCDRSELRSGEGPCIEAAVKEATVVVPSVAEETRWQAWTEQTAREGFATSLAVPGEVGPTVTVTLDVYSRAAERWTAPRIETAEAVVRLVAAAVRVHLRFTDLEDAAAGVYRSMADTVVVERALGAIMASDAGSRDEAHRTLRAAARGHGLSERAVAESILRSLDLGGHGEIADEREP
jgi:GAF domain-containing protein